jgi:hypothetical protein
MKVQIKYSVFGKIVLAERSDKGWALYYVGNEGKIRPAYDLVVPDFIGEDELEGYLADLCHEWGTGQYPDVYRIEI